MEDDIGRYIQRLKVTELKDFAIRALDVYGDTNKLNQSNQVIGLLLAMLKKRKQIREDGSYDPWVEVMIVAGLLHNLLYDGTLTSVFAAREKTRRHRGSLQGPSECCVQRLPSDRGTAGR